MLILTRKIDQELLIYTPAGVIRVMVMGIERDRAKIGVDAPSAYLVLRAELAPSATRTSGAPARSKGAA